MDVKGCETDRLLSQTNPSSTRVFQRRWWILGVVSYVGALQGMVWNSFGPISDSSELVFGWTNANIALITNLANMGYTLSVIPVGLFMEAKGLKMSTILSAVLLFLCCTARCITRDSTVFTYIVYVSSFFVGVAGVVPYGGPSMVAAVWFPMEQRTTAAAIVSLSNYVGVALQFILGPLFVPDPIFESQEINLSIYNKAATSINDSNYAEFEITQNLSDKYVVPKNLQEIRNGIGYLMYYHAGSSAVLLIIVLVYFPSKPPIPPSVTASIQRVNYSQALKAIFHNKQLWFVILLGAIPRSIVGTWIAIFDIVAKQLGMSQVDAGWIGFLHVLIGCFAGIVFAKVADYASRYKKTLVLVISFSSVIFGSWTTLICTGIFDYDISSLYTACVLFGVTVNGMAPLFYELCAETAYPVGEGITGSAYTFIVHAISIVYLTVASVPIDNVDWLTWTTLASVTLPLPLFLFYKVQYKRSDIDIVLDI